MLGLTIRDTTDRAACIERLRQVEPYAVDGATVDEMVEGCALLDVIEAGQVVGAVAVDVRGEVATIRAAASEGRATYAELTLIEALLRRQGVREVHLYTRRPGLVRKLLAQGYELAECHMRKGRHGLQEIQ